jgi:copper chaperone NosL
VWTFIGLSLLTLLLNGCGGEPGTGPVQVKWDRDTCERCRMVLSDRMHAAQVGYQGRDGRSRVSVFDDIGCAVVWLQDKPWRDQPGTEIWVADWRTGDWIDARLAVYLPDQVTPMGYGLGAQREPDPQGLDFAQAKARIFEVEERYNRHGAHLHAQKGKGSYETKSDEVSR